jgi:hypothetical protein
MSSISYAKIYTFDKCYNDFKKSFFEMNMGENRYIIDTDNKTIVNLQWGNDTKQDVINRFNIVNIDKDKIKAENLDKEIFKINLTAFLTEKKIELAMFLYDTNTLAKTNVKYLYVCE